jgi:NAD(P)-dependent dehydrogenase (short-subunit alcohol dehydrogenase family)
MSDTAGRPILVTGASSGIGLETALYLAERGFPVCATMRDLGRRDQLEAEAKKRQVSVQVEALDVTNPASIERVVRALQHRHGGVYAVVNNAGVQLRGYFEDCSDDEIRSVFEVNLFGTMAVVRAVLPLMRAARQGRIVIVSSVGGLLGSIGLSAYCASKHALEGFGESLSLEVAGLGLQVSIVEPAIVKTEIWERNKHIARAAVGQQSPYEGWFHNEERLSDELVATARTSKADVARTVYQALCARRPRLRYVVGDRVSALVLVRRYVPAALFERLYFGEVIRRVTGARG